MSVVEVESVLVIPLRICSSSSLTKTVFTVVFSIVLASLPAPEPPCAWPGFTRCQSLITLDVVSESIMVREPVLERVYHSPH